MNRKVLFLDMDNTLAQFSKGKYDDADACRRAEEKGFFLHLKPLKNIWVYNVLSLFMPIYIVSACNKNPYCRPEKREWLRRHMCFIRSKYIIFTNVGENKAQKVQERLGRSLRETDLLVDDFGVNLQEWYDAGGTPVKKSFNPNKKREMLVLYDHSQILSILKKA